MDNLQWQLVGDVVLVQVQLRRIKVGDQPRIYTPDGCLQPVETITVGRYGITALLDGKTVLDAHHKDHPQSGYQGSNAISFGFTSHYAKMQERFGSHLTIGISGENIIVETDSVWTEDDFLHGVALQSPDENRLELKNVFAAAPCRPFTAFCMGQHDVNDERQAVKANLRFLSGGTRGFYAELADDSPFSVRRGYTLWRAVVK